MGVLSDDIIKARKAHRCDAYHWIDHYRDGGIPEQRDYRCPGIKPGDEYHKQVNTLEGHPQTYKACFSCEDFAKKHEIPLEQI